MIIFKDARLPLGRDRRLRIDNWTLKPGEFWVIVGESGSGKSVLARTLAGVDAKGRASGDVKGMERSIDGRGIAEPGETSWIAFEREQLIRERLRRDDDSEVLGMPDEGMLINDFLETDRARDLANLGALRGLEGRGIRRLSTGEFRQALIAREAGKEPVMAVLDEPFEGLDLAARPRLKALLAEWATSGILLVLTVNRLEDIPDEATNLALLDGCSLAYSGSLPMALSEPAVVKLFGKEDHQDTRGSVQKKIPTPPNRKDPIPDVLIQMNGVSLSFNGRPVLRKIHWTVHRGESWLISGPNGSGKTTLMNLISGVEPRGYGQDFSLFGRKRGSGETLGEIRSRLSLVSAAWQELVPLHQTVLEIVGSGLQDSLVLMNELDGFEKDLARQWLDCFEMLEKADQPFIRLSYGERRLVMIARAMIKQPPLLLLDEPMHGLDGASRRQVSAAIELLVQQTGTTVLFVSHRKDDAPKLIKNHLELRPLGGDGSEAVISLRI